MQLTKNMIAALVSIKNGFCRPIGTRGRGRKDTYVALADHGLVRPVVRKRAGLECFQLTRNGKKVLNEEAHE